MAWLTRLMLASTYLLHLSCAALGTPIVLEPVGPVPLPSTPKVEQSGFLKVYSAVETANPDEPGFVTHTAFRLYRGDAETFTRIENGYGEPWKIPLAPGHYKIVAIADRYGWVVVPVVIEAGRTTLVFLDSGFAPPEGVSKIDMVRLPDGKIVGWRAKTAD